MSIFFSGVYAISFFPFLVVIVIFLGIAEERALVAQYGSAYREYQQEVPFLIPFVKMSEWGDEETEIAVWIIKRCNGLETHPTLLVGYTASPLGNRRGFSRLDAGKGF